VERESTAYIIEENPRMRRKVAALVFTVLSIAVVAPTAGAEGTAQTAAEPNFCVHSKILLGDDPICVGYRPF
jgi:hypothetical protein